VSRKLGAVQLSLFGDGQTQIQNVLNSEIIKLSGWALRQKGWQLNDPAKEDTKIYLQPIN
jgi:hypothetical protein